MKRLLVFAFIIIALKSCSSNKTLSNRIVLEKVFSISKDSVIFLEPGFSMWRYGGDFNFNFPQESFGRKDTVIFFLTSTLIDKLKLNLTGYDKASNCLHNVFTSDNIRKKQKDLLDFRNYECIKMRSDLYYVYFFFSLDIYEASMAMSDENDVINANALIFKDGEIIYSHHIRNKKISKPSNFPRNSIDRKDFPHFTNEQIQIAVNKITEDLMKKIK